MKPRLLIIHNRLVVGGPALDTIPLAYYLKDDFDIHVLYGVKEKDEVEPTFLLQKYKGLTLINVTSLQRSINFLNDTKAYKFILQYIKEFKPHIVHTHGAKAGVFGRIAAKKAEVPYIIHTFHGHLFHSYFNTVFTSLYISLEKMLVKNTNLIIAISDSQKKELIQTLKIDDQEKIKIVSLGVDYIDELMSDHFRHAFKRTYQLESANISVGIFGRMAPIKNPLFFLKIAESVLRDSANKHIKFFVIGDGSETEHMKNYLRQNSIHYSTSSGEAPVVFTSWIQNIQNVLEGLDIVVLTSLNEGTPLSLIEAQLCGKPVVAVNVGGVKDTMLDGETGFLINTHNIKEFADAILKLANDPELRKRMGKKGKHFASTRFSKTKEVERMKNIYLSYQHNYLASNE